MSTETSRSILLVEDSAEDYEVTRRAFANAGLRNLLVWCETGDQALDYLHRRGEHRASVGWTLPGIVLLDLNLPGTDGREVLLSIKGSEVLREIPVVILTTSSDERDVSDCYRAGASSYIQKPPELDRFMEAVARLRDYWFGTVILPRGDA